MPSVYFVIVGLCIAAVAALMPISNPAYLQYLSIACWACAACLLIGLVLYFVEANRHEQELLALEYELSLLPQLRDHKE